MSDLGLTGPQLAALPTIAHRFFGRDGGTSTGPFASLNCALAGDDAPDNRARNRAIAVAAFASGDWQLAAMHQIHGNRIVAVTPDNADALPKADGLVTATPGIALSVLTADCTPVLFADPEADVIGACHAGWKGAVGGVVQNTVAAMAALGARPGRIVVALGPAIGATNYEVGETFAQTIREQYPHAGPHIVWPDGAVRPHFDVAGTIEDALAAAGIARFESIGPCTYAAADRFFSHRHANHARTATGRQLSLIGLRR